MFCEIYIRLIQEGKYAFCKPVPAHTTGQYFFDLFVETTSSYGIDCKKCIAICSDGAKVITRKKSGLNVKLKTHMLTALWMHCFLH
jgi:hypothetical protein